MSNSYIQLYIHFVIAVTYKAATVQEEWEDQLHKHIKGIVQNNHHKMLAINSLPDHVHIFIGMNARQSISQLMDLTKQGSADFINDNKFTQKKFHWQEGYGAFGNHLSEIGEVVKYILNQKEHHRKITFREEFINMLIKNDVDYDEKDIFHELLD